MKPPTHDEEIRGASELLDKVDEYIRQAHTCLNGVAWYTRNWEYNGRDEAKANLIEMLNLFEALSARARLMKAGLP